MKKILLLILILFVSCKTTKKVEHYTGTHYSATELASQLNLGKYSVIDESKFGELHIYIYDTSLAKDTGGGFYSPSLHSLITGDGIAGNCCIAVTYVGIARWVIDRRSDVKGSF